MKNKITLLLLALLTLAVKPIQAVTVQDSLALAALYNSTNGNSWTFNSNWLTTPVNKWHGIKVTGNRVTEINLSSNNLTGTLPAELGNLTQLVSLKMYSNALTGTIPASIGNLTQLTTLYLYSNQLSGSIPEEMGNLTSLTDLQLHSCRLSGSIPAKLGNLKALINLYLYSNQLSGSIPVELCSLYSLQRLYLHYNQLSGSIPANIGLLQKMTTLYLSNNNLTGEIPPSFALLTKLSSLYLHYNKLTGEIPPELGNMASLYSLYLNNNALRGEIPAELGKLKNLRYLFMQVNQLQGSIPPELGNITYLYQLNLSINQLSGTLPSELAKLTYLTILDVSTNQITGSIPPELSNLTRLTDLILDRNEFMGDIPQSFNRLSNLQTFTVTSNKFSGFLADSLESLANLSTISVYYNDLTFEDLEDKTDLFNKNFYYSPQNPIGSKMIVSVEPGASYTLKTECGGTANLYQWFFNDQPLSPLATTASYRLTNIQEDNIGSYVCHITNTIVPNLTIKSAPIVLQFKAAGESAPTDILLSNSSIDEGLPVGTKIGEFSAVDDDFDEEHFYSFADGDGDDNNNCFYIAANQLLTNMEFNFEEKNSYTIRVETEDEAGMTYQKAFIITINDVAELVPNTIILSNNALDEHLPAGTLVGNLSTACDDSILSGSFSYSLADISNHDNNYFYISDNELHSLASFNYNEQKSYAIEIRSEDVSGNSVQQAFTIQINNVEELPPTGITLSNNTVNENSPIGTFIGTFTTEGDISAPESDYTYTLVEGEGSDNNSDFFIAVNQLRSNAEFNFEEKASFTLRVQSEDLLGYTLEKSFTITINDLDDTHDITIPDAFTPNGDGKNDYFEIPGIENYSSAVIDIYNRYGKLIYHHDHYGLPTETSEAEWWDGRLNAKGEISSKILPEGYYFVVLKIDMNTIYKRTIFLKS